MKSKTLTRPHVIVVEYLKKKVAKIPEKKDQANTMTDSFSLFYPVHDYILTAAEILIQFETDDWYNRVRGESYSRDGSRCEKRLVRTFRHALPNRLSTDTP